MDSKKSKLDKDLDNLSEIMYQHPWLYSVVMGLISTLVLYFGGYIWYYVIPEKWQGYILTFIVCVIVFTIIIRLSIR